MKWRSIAATGSGPLRDPQTRRSEPAAPVGIRWTQAHSGVLGICGCCGDHHSQLCQFGSNVLVTRGLIQRTMCTFVALGLVAGLTACGNEALRS